MSSPEFFAQINTKNVTLAWTQRIRCLLTETTKTRLQPKSSNNRSAVVFSEIEYILFMFIVHQSSIIKLNKINNEQFNIM